VKDALCESETQENTHLSKVGGRKRKECAVFDYKTDNPKQKNGREKVIAQH